LEVGVIFFNGFWICVSESVVLVNSCSGLGIWGLKFEGFGVILLSNES